MVSLRPEGLAPVWLRAEEGWRHMTEKSNGRTVAEKSNGKPTAEKPNGTPVLEKLHGKSIQEWLEVHPGWNRKSNALIKEYRLASFRDSIVFVNRIAGLADAADHHPDFDVRSDERRGGE